MHGIILAGGSGTRFWPLSREGHPKQLLRVFGDHTLIQATLSRIAPLIPAERVHIVTQAHQAEQIRMQIPSAALPAPSFICEPSGKNTAAAIGLAAMILQKEAGDGVMAVLSADHFIRDEAAFLAALTAAGHWAEAGYLVTFGARPTRPETAYGYIQRGAPVAEGAVASCVARFVEKPSAAEAARHVQREDMYWNTGIFVWRTSVLLEEMGRFLPDLSAGLKEIQTHWGTADAQAVLERVYSRLPSLSIDHGVLEKSRRLAVIPIEMGWEDVGSWHALDNVVPKDAEANILTGNVVNIGSRNSTVYANKRLVAVVGLHETVVVDTEDATLVCAKNAAQDVKKVVEQLKRENREEYRTHRTVHRPWGAYTVLEEGAGYKIKRIEVRPGARLSLQSHQKRSEHWVVLSGVARVTRDGNVYTLSANESTFIPVGEKHRLENSGQTPLEIIEVQTGGYLGEDDIARYQDDYGRLAEHATQG